MRITFLPVIISFLLIFSVAISCFDSSEEVEYSSDDTIHAFELDTIYGINYSFTIDQINGAIFNIDSVPLTADTIINKILITTLETGGYVYTDNTLLNMTDSFDFSRTMEQPFKLSVVTLDGKYSRDYTLEVRIHKQDPDSLVWTKMAPSFSGEGDESGERKSVILGEKIFVYTYTSDGLEGYYTSLNDGRNWTKMTNLPDHIKLSSLLACEGKLYALTEEGGDVYFSEDGALWNEHSALSGNRLETFITSFPHTINGIKNENGIKKFCVTNPDFSGWETGKEVLETFPMENISSTVYKTKTGIWKAFIAGETMPTDSPYTVPWFSIDGKEWTAAEAPVGNDDTTYDCPYMKQPSIIYYNDRFYVFGGGFDGFYTSPEGLTWSHVKKKMFFPEYFGEASYHPYSIVIDKDNFIWMIWGQKGEVWRGRINKLGFKIK
ncbi:hypothetical protein EZS27_003132 [termite gut metagenome]|uniref:Uncharacterized protein n=1 Tax=termite gut metagenome TaxID=433724 RepID=A0A5J4STB1_9ZZZZ